MGGRFHWRRRAPLADMEPARQGLTVDQLAATVQSLAKTVKTMRSWDDRMGSAVKRLWHQTLTIFLLLGILALMVRGQRQDRPEVAPYLYVVDPQGEVLWQGTPGMYEIRDAFVLNHLEDWVIDVRSRDDDPSLVRLWKAWTRAEAMTLLGDKTKAGECWDRFQAYMREADPRQLPNRPRVEVKITSKRILARQETQGEYRLAWQEVELGRSGQIVRRSSWEGDFTVTLQAPRSFAEAQRTNRYGVVLARCSWGESATVGGL